MLVARLLAPMFQSAPVIADGRARSANPPSIGMASFNPRPSSLTGELITSNRLIPLRNLPKQREPQGKSALS